MRSPRSTTALFLALLLLSKNSCHSFVVVPMPQTTTTTARKLAFFDELSYFYLTKPLQSAVLTCGVKASVADAIAQVRASYIADGKNTNFILNGKRNVAYILYGGLFVGAMCHVEYNLVFPVLFGTEQTLSTIVKKVLFDDFVSAPLFWLPPAYLIKSAVFGYSWQEGLQKYRRDIRQRGLLVKYWSVWVPAQTISFSVIPPHLRVAFMASVSFFWFILLSTLSSSQEKASSQ